MLTIKKRTVNDLACFLVAMMVLGSSGCKPPGPRALLSAEKLIEQGHYDQALQKLQLATQLLPKNAQAWNHLGLAYHGNKQPDLAWRAYRQSLLLDPKLAAARFNLGCLLLEQNRPVEAIDELTSYTMLQSRSVDGWLKLGTAQLRARRVDAAEKSFRAALDLAPRHPEALNGLGHVQLARKRWPDALQLFNMAVAERPNYAPALLNAAVVLHKSANNRPSALQFYRRYLALQPRPAQWQGVSTLAAQLDAELNPPPIAVVAAPKPPTKPDRVAAPISPTPRPDSATVGTAPALSPTRVLPSSPAADTTKLPASVALNPALLNPPAPETPKPATPNAGPGTVAQLVPEKVAAAAPAAPAPPVVLSPAATSKPSPPPPVVSESIPVPQVEVMRVQDQLLVKPVWDVPPPKRAEPIPSSPVSVAVSSPPPVLAPEPKAKPEKKSLLSRLNPARLNPFSGKPKPAKPPVLAPLPPVPPDLAPVSSNKIVLAEASPIAEVPAAPPQIRVPRYAYVSPGQPASGNRATAEPYFLSGVKQQQAGRSSEASGNYRKALQFDPSYFEAHYNLGLASYEAGQWKDALLSYERALALRPDSTDARYNFALTLKQANYPQDAANELLLVLNRKPSETRAQFSLANLYAQQLNQPERAREYYLKVLQGEPQHPQAVNIRSWLVAHP